jgi:hypothetical protein
VRTLSEDASEGIALRVSNIRPDAGERLCRKPPQAFGYAAGEPKGATGFDVGCEPSGAYRGAVPS